MPRKSQKVQDQNDEEAEALALITKPKARVEAYGKIIARIKKSFVDYSERFPDTAEKQEFVTWVHHVVSDIGEVLEILDNYEIEYKRDNERPN